jgi:hypothetical protein
MRVVVVLAAAGGGAGPLWGAFILAFSAFALIFSLFRLRGNAWKSRSVGWGTTDHTNLLASVVGLGIGASMLLGWS